MVGPAMGAWIKLALIVAAAVACVEPQTEAACEAASLAAGLAIGGGGYEFAGTYHSEGCYAYANGTYTGMAFWSTLRNLNTGLGRRQYRVCEAAIGALASSSGSFSYSFDDDGDDNGSRRDDDDDDIPPPPTPQPSTVDDGGPGGLQGRVVDFLEARSQVELLAGTAIIALFLVTCIYQCCCKTKFNQEEFDAHEREARRTDSGRVLGFSQMFQQNTRNDATIQMGENPMRRNPPAPAPAPARAPAPAPAAATGPLPEGWSAIETDQGETYYYCEGTGETSWERPPAPEPAADPLPEGWEAIDANDGETYFYNTATGESTWDRPR